MALADVEKQEPQGKLAETLHRISRRPRRDLLAVTGVLICLVIFLVSSRTLYAGNYVRSKLANYATSHTPYLRDATQSGHIIPAPSNRYVDLSDSFANYTQSPTCSLSSLDLHEPFHPLCVSKASLLQAMTDGGRAGLDSPYIPRACDMRWYTAQELCGILSRFETLHVIGDSMMRNLAVALNTLVRADLVEGPHLTIIPDPDGLDCRCAGAFGGSACLFNSAFSTRHVLNANPDSYVCDTKNMGHIEFSTQLSYPLPVDGLDTLDADLPADVVPSKPHAFVFGHGLWDNLNMTASQLWLGQLTTHIQSRLPYLAHPDAFFPRLYMTPNAAGPNKHAEFELSQGNAALVRFEHEMGVWVRNEGYDHLGTWNLTVQGISPDGTHAGMKSVLVKAMMVYNWLDWVGREQIGDAWDDNDIDVDG